jgi:tetratricopeptide (TPR) repeat protein
VIENLPKTPLSDEAHYRIGYAWETAGDDFDKARASYQIVRDRAGSTGFGMQAADRLRNLDRIARFRSETGDSVHKETEEAFLLAEQYLFQLEKPERAMEEYQKVVDRFPGTPVAAKAMNAQAWVLSRKLERGGSADSLLWRVVREHPGTEAQIAARDYLEERGQTVPAELIVLPKAPEPEPEVAQQSLTAPPTETPRLGETHPPGDREMLGPTGAPLPYRMTVPDSIPATSQPPDTMMQVAPRDTARAPATSFAPTARDSALRRVAVDSTSTPSRPKEK